MRGKFGSLFRRFLLGKLPGRIQADAEGFASVSGGVEYYFRAGFLIGRRFDEIKEADERKKMRIYVAGKITGCDKAEVLAKFGHAAAMLRAKGHAVFVPTCLPDYGEDKVSHSDYMHICRAMIDVCDAVYFLRDWKESRGATEEHSYAKERRKLLSFEDEPSPGCGR